MFGIEKYRRQAWSIVRVGRRVAQQIVIRHVLYPAADMQCDKGAMEHAAVVRMIHRLHRMWFDRVKELISRNLWRPGDTVSTQSQLWTFRRVMHCRPSCVFFSRGNKALLRPCKRYRACPFCWARTGAFVYRRFRRRIRTAAEKNSKLVLTYRVISQHVPVADFNPDLGLSPEQMLTNMRRLKDIFDRYKAVHARTVKQLQRKTRGSACRIVVDPQDNGWRIEMRQLFLAPAKTRLPMVRLREATTTHRECADVTDDDAIELALGSFLAYPSGLLTAYIDLTAVYLNAAHNLRLMTGTGLFRACGQGLARAFKQDKQHGEVPVQRGEEIGPPVRDAGDSSQA